MPHSSHTDHQALTANLFAVQNLDALPLLAQALTAAGPNASQQVDGGFHVSNASYTTLDKETVISLQDVWVGCTSEEDRNQSAGSGLTSLQVAIIAVGSVIGVTLSHPLHLCFGVGCCASATHHHAS